MKHFGICHNHITGGYGVLLTVAVKIAGTAGATEKFCVFVPVWDVGTAVRDAAVDPKGEEGVGH